MIEIEQLHDVYQAKLIPVSNKSLFMIGGQSTEERSDAVTKVKKTVTELYWNDFTSQWRIKQKDYMLRERASFGATLSKDKSLIFVTGGYINGFKVDKETEVYDIAANKWCTGTPMKTRRIAHSIC